MVSTQASSSLRGVVTGTLLFASGCMVADRVKHFIGARGADTPPPYVSVEYSSEGTFIDKQRYANGKLGGPRCDWNEIPREERTLHSTAYLTQSPNVLASAISSLPRESVENIIHGSLTRLARTDGVSVDGELARMRERYNVRWSMPAYTPLGQVQTP